MTLPATESLVTFCFFAKFPTPDPDSDRREGGAAAPASAFGWGRAAPRCLLAPVFHLSSHATPDPHQAGPPAATYGLSTARTGIPLIQPCPSRSSQRRWLALAPRGAVRECANPLRPLYGALRGSERHMPESRLAPEFTPRPANMVTRPPALGPAPPPVHSRTDPARMRVHPGTSRTRQRAPGASRTPHQAPTSHCAPQQRPIHLFSRCSIHRIRAHNPT